MRACLSCATFSLLRSRVGPIKVTRNASVVLCLQETLSNGSIDRKSPVNLIIGCVDNMEARQTMEAMSEELQVPYMDCVVSDDAMQGCVQLIIPGRTGGLEASLIKSHMDKRAGSCPASLPTTDSIIAGLAAQNALKYLLAFGEVAFLISYNAITNDFNTRMTYPSPDKLKPGAVPPKSDQ